MLSLHRYFCFPSIYVIDEQQRLPWLETLDGEPISPQYSRQQSSILPTPRIDRVLQAFEKGSMFQRLDGRAPSSRSELVSKKHRTQKSARKSLTWKSLVQTSEDSSHYSSDRQTSDFPQADRYTQRVASHAAESSKEESKEPMTLPDQMASRLESIEKALYSLASLQPKQDPRAEANTAVKSEAHEDVKPAINQSVHTEASVPAVDIPGHDPTAVRLAVAGSHMRELPFNDQLRRLNSVFVTEAQTSANYKLYVFLKHSFY